MGLLADRLLVVWLEIRLPPDVNKEMTDKKLIQEEVVSFDNLMTWRAALATCAIEGNQYAKEQLVLWSTNREAFIAEYLHQKEEVMKGMLYSGQSGK